jgi:hypothetical protein
MKVVSPATTSVLRFVPRSENLKKVPKVSISPLPFYVRENIAFQQVSTPPCRRLVGKSARTRAHYKLKCW